MVLIRISARNSPGQDTEFPGKTNQKGSNRLMVKEDPSASSCAVFVSVLVIHPIGIPVG
jgi:hypothetical protein